MKRIAIYCDGTWNRNDRAAVASEGRSLTNIVHLYEATMSGTAPDGVKQSVCYIDGVGTPESSGWLQYAIDKFGGGVFGWGLNDKILQGYRYLIKNYEPGDEVYVFGFSRGAYTARSLVGLLRNCGLPKREDKGLLKHLMGVYRSRRDGDAPWAERARRLREWVNPNLVTHPDDLVGHPAGDNCTLFAVTYLGIFDTVGALGVPEIWPNIARVNREYQFHDTILTSMVKSGRHAIAIDEPRITYKAVPWDHEKLVELNARSLDAAKRPYRQEWFPGVHGTIGGSLEKGSEGLGMRTLGWIAEGAAEMGLAYDPYKMAAFQSAENATGPFMSPGQSYGFPDGATIRRFPYKRPDVSAEDGISITSEDRWRAAQTGKDWPYRPAQLRKLAKSKGWPD